MGLTWFLQRNGEEEGPFTASRLSEMAIEGKIFPHDYVKRSDMEKWVVAGRVKGLRFQGPPPESSSQTSENQSAGKSKLFKQAKTLDGEIINLYDDGHWEFVKPQSEEVKSDDQNQSCDLIRKPVSGPHFRKTAWGMSEREVRDSEDDEPEHEINSGFTYSGSIAGLPCSIVYIFSDHQLVRAKYFLLQDHSNPNKHIDDYYKLRELLVEKYGSPVSKTGVQGDLIWFDDLFMDDINDWGRAVECGHLAFQAEWVNGDTHIVLVLSGDNYDVRHEIEYKSVSLQKLEDDETQQRNLRDL